MKFIVKPKIFPKKIYLILRFSLLLIAAIYLMFPTKLCPNNYEILGFVA